MSLDIYFSFEGAHRLPGSGIFVREHGQTREITEEEWQQRYPGLEPVRLLDRGAGSEDVYHGNITHNLQRMAREAGLYEALWAPQDHDYHYAGDLIHVLRMGLAELELLAEQFQAYNPKNGWGTYETLVTFVQDCLEAALRWPCATIQVSV